MQGEKGVTIRMSELRMMEVQGKEGERIQVDDNTFACYLSANLYLWHSNDGLELHAKDTLTLPVRPIRRKGCHTCLSKNLSCEFCEKCHKVGKTCCRSLNCIYELSKYLDNRQASIYKRCGCCSTFQPSNQNFSVDWRLLSLLQKLRQIKIVKYSYFLHYKCGILFVSEEEFDKSQDRKKTNRIVFQESYNSQTLVQSKSSIKDRNVVSLQKLFQANIVKYVKNYDHWKEDDIQGSCEEIINKFQSNQQLQLFKRKMQTPSLVGQHEYSSGFSLSEPKKYKNVSETTSKINHSRFQELSSAVNKHIIFFYHNQSKSLVVKNAAYEEKDRDTSSIKIYGIMSDINYDLSSAVWFKDRKGDIFAIHKQFISIFKFHVGEKKYKQIVLREDRIYENIVDPEAIVYVPQLDRVYFFDQNNFGRSFYFQLYRPFLEQKQFSNCLSVNLSIPLPSRLNLFYGLLFVKAIYAMQEVAIGHSNNPKNEKQATKNVQMVPVIYLLLARKQSRQIFSLYRFVHGQSFYELKQVKREEQGEQNELDFDQDIGIFTTFRKETQNCLCLQTQFRGNPLLIQGKLTPKEPLQVEWQFHNKVLYHVKPQSKTVKLQKLKIIKDSVRSRSKYLKNPELLLINDVAGSKTNSTTRYLGFSPATNTFLEITLHLNEGEYTWQVAE